jgi:hypothetical protein
LAVVAQWSPDDATLPVAWITFRATGLAGECHWRCGCMSKDGDAAVPKPELEPSTFRLRVGP